MSFALWRGTEDWTDCWSCFYMEEVNNNSGVAAATTSQITFPFVTVNIFATAAADMADHCTFHLWERRGAKDSVGHSCPSYHFSAAHTNHCTRTRSNCPLAPYPSHSLPAAHCPNQKPEPPGSFFPRTRLMQQSWGGYPCEVYPAQTQMTAGRCPQFPRDHSWKAPPVLDTSCCCTIFSETGCPPPCSLTPEDGSPLTVCSRSWGPRYLASLFQVDAWKGSPCSTAY